MHIKLLIEPSQRLENVCSGRQKVKHFDYFIHKAAFILVTLAVVIIF